MSWMIAEQDQTKNFIANVTQTAANVFQRSSKVKQDKNSFWGRQKMIQMHFSRLFDFLPCTRN